MAARVLARLVRGARVIKASDIDALCEFANALDVTITIEAVGIKKTFKESNCARVVNGKGRATERAYLLEKRLIELARDVLHDRGELDLT